MRDFKPNNLQNCPICGAVELEIGVRRPDNKARLECPCGISGMWGKGLSGAIEGWARLTVPIDQMRALVHEGDMAAGQPKLDERGKTDG